MNSWLTLFSEPWTQRLGWVLIHFLWQGTGIAILLAAILRLASRASSHVRYVMIGSAFLLCAVLPVATWMILGTQASSSMASVTVLNPTDAPHAESPVMRGSAPPHATGTMESLGNIQTHWQDNLSRVADASLPYVVGLWFAGVLILTLRLTMGWMLLRRVCLSGLPIHNAFCLERFRILLERMQLGVPVRLLESALVEVPTLIGWVRPTILVPASVFMGLTPDQLEAILAHELAHVRRYDYLVNLFQTVIETVLFYHPAVWWISRKLREERENCCDDIALEIMKDRFVYASALALLEEGRAMPLAMTASGGSLIQRIRRIAGANDRKVSALPLGIVILILIAVIGISIRTTRADAPASKTTDAVKTTAQAQSAADKRDDELFNDLRIENLKVQDMPLDRFVEKIHNELQALDPKKQGINFVLNIPPGEPPISVSLDFTKIPHYRANIEMILSPLKARYPIRYKTDVVHGTIYIQQIPKDEIGFDKKAVATLIDIDFTQTDPVTALKTVQDASANKGFAFNLDLKMISELDAIKKLPLIDLKATQVSVDQVLRSIFYLADLHPIPLPHFTGYTIQAQSPDATKALTYLDVGTQPESFKMGTGAEDQIRENFQKPSPWYGPSMHGLAYRSDGTQMGPMTIAQKVPPPNGDLEQSFTVDPKIIDKAHIQVATSLEIKDSHENSLGKVSGKATLVSGERAILTSSRAAAISLPGKGTDPGLGFVGVMQVTLVNEDGQPLLPPPSPGMKEIPISLTGIATPAASLEVSESADAVKNPNLTKALIAAAQKGDAAQAAQLLKQGADPKANLSPDQKNALFVAAENNQVEVLKLLLKNGADPNCANSCGNAPIDWTLSRGNLEAATVLHDAGAKISPESWAAATGDLITLSALAKSGVLKKGKTDGAMHYATSMGQLEAVKFLENIEGKPVAGKFLAQAARSGNIPMLDYILSRGANIKTDGGDAMDQSIIFFNQPESVKWLLAHGVDPNHFSK